MIIISEERVNELLNRKFTVYTKEPLHEGCECFTSNETFDKSSSYYISDIKVSNIRHNSGKFYYTKEDLNTVADMWPADELMPIIGAFSSAKKHKLAKACLVDASMMPAFNGSQFTTNEDLTVNEYRFYLTLFNDYSVKQCQYERHNLYDAMFKSSKFDLPSRIQNSNFLKSKDFTVINYRRKEIESVPVGWIIKEDTNNKYTVEYGKVYINMDNQIAIIWH